MTWIDYDVAPAGPGGQADRSARRLLAVGLTTARGVGHRRRRHSHPHLDPPSPRRRTRRTAPCLLYGYGSYELSEDPTFSIARLNLVDRGVVFAIAHVRGGGEMGRDWYDNGKMLRKRNTFTDFIACAHHLIDNGWCAPDQLAARGGSAGGLLMGAVANMRPTCSTPS